MCKILDAQGGKPHEVLHYLERRDPECETKMAEVLCAYREVAVLKEAEATTEDGPAKVVIVYYHEKPSVQAIESTAADLPPQSGVHKTLARDHEYKRFGTLSLLAGIDPVSGKIRAQIKHRHRSREFIEFLKLFDQAYPSETALKIILDNHSAHIPKETKRWLAS